MKSEHKIIISVLVITVLTFIGLVWLMNRVQTPEAVDQAYLIGGDPFAKGAVEDQTILTIVEFSDFQCPACRAAAPLLEDFVESNQDKVRLIYRHFPLVSIHHNAREAAVASEVAGAEGKFWEYHNLLFERQEEWSQETDPTDLFVQYAVELELDSEMFRQNMGVDTYEINVRDDQNTAQDLNLNSTPTFFFNGELHRGVPTQDDLYNYLSEALE
jgi:protein-disulfide isomerase